MENQPSYTPEQVKGFFDVAASTSCSYAYCRGHSIHVQNMEFVRDILSHDLEKALTLPENVRTREISNMINTIREKRDYFVAAIAERNKGQ